MNKKIVKISSVLILIILSVFMLFQYDGIKNDIEKQNRKELIRDFMREIPGMEYSFAYDILGEKQFYEEYIELNENLSDDGYEMEWVKEDVTAILQAKDYHDLKSQFHYSMTIDGYPTTYTNTSIDLENMIEDSNALKNYYGYLVIRFDENGNKAIKGDLEGYSQEIENITKDIGTIAGLENIYNNAPIDGTYYYDQLSDVLEAKAIKNATVVYAIPNYDISDGNYYGWGVDILVKDYIIGLMPYFFIALSIVALYIFICPLKILATCHIYNVIKKVKLEIFIIGCGFFGWALMFATPMVAGVTSFQIAIPRFQHFIDNNVLTVVINLFMWGITFQLMAVMIFLLKYSMLNGFSYFNNNTCIAWILKKMKQWIVNVVNFDLERGFNKKLILFALLNFISLLYCIFSPKLGLFLGIIYTILLFVSIKRKKESEEGHYRSLLKATEELSNGNFDVQLNGNLGLFQALGDEFGRIKEGFETAVSEEVKSQQMKTELISNVSHDLKTPLTTIITYIDLLKTEKLSNQEREYVETLDASALRLKRLIEDLFEVSKANSGNIQLNLEAVDIVALLNQVRFENLNYTDNKCLDFKVHTSSNTIMLHLDSIKTYRIFDNLITNIYKYALTNTRVYIDISEVENTVFVTFKNISEQEIKMDSDVLSERFVQGDESRNQEGSGLGLAIVKSFTNIQGGEMNLFVDGDLFKVELIFKKESS